MLVFFRRRRQQALDVRLVVVESFRQLVTSSANASSKGTQCFTTDPHRDAQQPCSELLHAVTEGFVPRYRIGIGCHQLTQQVQIVVRLHQLDVLFQTRCEVLLKL
ncbi:hypothetical protein D3C85_1614780 [compost metagenome]